MEPPIIGVYKITNTISGRYYIGYSVNIKKRFRSHKYKLRTQTHDNIFMQRAYNCDGENCFVYEIIHTFNTEQEAKDKELEYLTDMNIRGNLYNLNFNNGGGDMITNHPDRANILERIKNSVIERVSKLTPEERKQKWSQPGEKNGMFGKTHTPEVRKILSEINIGHSRNKGIPLKESTKQKLSEKAKLRTGEKNHFYGKHHTEETKQKLREKSTGKDNGQGHKIVINNVNYNSISEASRKLNIPCPTVLWRLKSKNPKFINYKYAEPMQPSET